MGTSFVLTGGKGGTGKTSVSINLGLALRNLGFKVVVVDGDVAMANVGLMLGAERAPISLHNVLVGENPITDAVYEGPEGLKYVPAALSLERYKKLDMDKLKEAIAILERQYDFVILDSAPGIGADAEAGLKVVRDAVLVVVPEPNSLADAFKMKTFAEKLGVRVKGFIVNHVLGEKDEIKTRDLESVLGITNLGVLPEDIEVRRSSAKQVPAFVRAPDSPFSRAVLQVAGKISGAKVPETKAKKASLLDSIMALFKRK